MSRFLTLFMAITAVCLFTACNESTPRILPTGTGRTGEVGVVMDKVNWEGELGAAIRSTLSADYPHLPQREPLFNVFNISDKAFTRIYQQHRNLVLIRISPDIEEAEMVIQQNVWARPQIVVSFYGPDPDAIISVLEAQQERLVSAIEQAERNRAIANSKRYEEQGLRRLVTESFGGSPYFPSGYTLRKQSQDFIWISYETTYTSQGILIYSYPYVDSASLSKAVVLQMRNSFVGREVPGELPNSYMTTNMSETDGPSIRWVRYNNKDFAELRGLWEVENDFMGGPFISHSLIDTRSHRVLVIEAFVYNPKSEKRNYLRQTESILYSFEWSNGQEE